MSRGPASLILALCLTPSLAGRALADDPTAARIARVEAGLLAPIVWKGEPRLTMRLQERMAHHQVPGVSLAVVDNGALSWARSWGVVRAGEPGRVTPETLFQAGSVSKTVTAMLALRYASQGRVGVDDPVNRRLSSWQLPDSEAGGRDAVTIRHLLTHSAGLTQVTYLGVEPTAAVPTSLDLLNGEGPAGVAPIRRIEPPGRRFSYSNSAYLVLQQALTDVSGLRFDELAQKALFAPLEMVSSSFASTLPAALADRAACGHAPRLQPNPSKGVVVPAAVGGLWTTPSDLARLLVAFFNSYKGDPGGVCTPALAREAIKPEIESQGLVGAIEGAGAGARLQQMGALPGFVALVVAYPELGRGAVVMMNSGGNNGELIREIARAIATEYAWPGFVREYERAELGAAALNGLVGTYEFDNPPGFRIPISAKDGHLYWGDREMVPVVGGTFVIPSAGAEVEFLRDASGAVVALGYQGPGSRRIRVKRVS